MKRLVILCNVCNEETPRAVHIEHSMDEAELIGEAIACGWFTVFEYNEEYLLCSAKCLIEFAQDTGKYRTPNDLYSGG